MNASAATPLIQAQQLGKHITTPEGDLLILNHIDLNINAGETVAIMGRSGSGKSTLLGLLAGLDKPTTGKISLAGKILNDLDEDARARIRCAHVGFVFQQFHLLPVFTALENVMLPLELKGIANAKEQAQLWLERVGLTNRMTHTPKQLSGGEQQRVAIARAFAVQPSIVFADEPTGNLDAHTSEKIVELIFNVQREQNTTLILVTHDQQLAKQCMRSILLEAGELVKS
ncbi:MAG: ABC transporter ATP-binding protein [Legionellales bacterium]|jgi:putative ABC transport system ATP-binding protein